VGRFYGEVLGLPLVAAWHTGVAFRIGAGTLLLTPKHRGIRRGNDVACAATAAAGAQCAAGTRKQKCCGRETRTSSREPLGLLLPSLRHGE
jgi:hypothetical protein